MGAGGSKPLQRKAQEGIDDRGQANQYEGYTHIAGCLKPEKWRLELPVRQPPWNEAGEHAGCDSKKKRRTECGSSLFHDVCPALVALEDRAFIDTFCGW
jgi:hypothetical protein